MKANTFSKVVTYSGSIVTLLAAVFIVLRGFSHFNSLWLDEAMLALNIVDKDIVDLFKPLEMNQVAPIGFLIVEKLIAATFNYSDWAFRVFPLISYLLSIVVYYLVTIKVFEDKKFAIVSTAFYSSLYYVISHSIEVKQYMSDVFICLLILYHTLIFVHNKTSKQVIIYSLIGCILIWFSNIAIIVLITVGLFLLYKSIF